MFTGILYSSEERLDESSGDMSATVTAVSITGYVKSDTNKDFVVTFVGIVSFVSCYS